jgi:hypothetical protein
MLSMGKSTVSTGPFSRARLKYQRVILENEWIIIIPLTSHQSISSDI